MTVPVLDIHHILNKLPHRYPILLVDRVLEIERGVRAADTVAEDTSLTGQVAATIAALLGEDFRTGVPAAAPPLPGVTERETVTLSVSKNGKCHLFR